MSLNLKADTATRVPERIICVLGMHRSGTSCLTGSLQEAGLFLGDCHTWNPHNRKGNRENQAFVDLHDGILAANGGAWDNPPAAVQWLPEHVQAGRALLAAHADQALFGFKDPRSLLVLEGWKSIFPALEFIGIFRHPEAVARSLSQRSEMPREEGLALWYKYNKLLLKEYRRRAFPLLCFDEEQPVFEAKLAGVIKDLDIGGNALAPDFYDDSLRTAGQQQGPALPWKVQRLYRKLARRAL